MIFDMDGVLVDTNPVHREAWISYNFQYGIRTDPAMERRMYGRHNDEIVRDFFGAELDPEQVRRHGAAKEALFRQTMAGSIERVLVPGVRGFLECHAGAPLALASNAEQANVDFVLDGAGLRPYFRAAVSGHQVRHPKPHPEIYLHTADVLGVSPANCIVFEDSETGVAAALAAGMRTVGVATTHGNLPGVSLLIRDFLDPALEPWLASQERE
jgi:beta-phosphoglucomutase family hydrolase